MEPETLPRRDSTLPWVFPTAAEQTAFQAAMQRLGIAPQSQARHSYSVSSVIPMDVGGEPLYRVTIALYRKAWCGQIHSAGGMVVFVACRTGAVVGWDLRSERERRGGSA